ncbi:MAG TPA: hypothetical protein DDZ51_10190 [Planctomycetaceae bacterium]|nr:hypothetical protein [Planctomycetaceae bacterium]
MKPFPLHIVVALIPIATLVAVALHPAVSIGAESRIEFNRDIRPILSDACFQCHGPDEAERHGGLRLDSAAAAHRGGDSAVAIIPGDADASEVWRRVVSEDPDLLMPPPETGKTLSREQIALLRRWLQQGAEYQDHWAFLRVERPQVPAPVSSQKTLHPIDAFIRDRLAKEGLQPAGTAGRETLIRRVTLDLIGLPPTPAEVDAFLTDDSPNAYEKLVDRLLASPHHGEHMARQWLDFARYADSNGFQVDSSREMWPWRDWVIDAFNRNLPFDQFTIEQLAGDLLPNATPDQIVATGFNRNTRLNGEGGRIVDEWFTETVIDRVETVGLTWMAITFNCCRCHDHKYDPITQKEFYQMFAFFNSIEESGVLDSEGGSPGRGNSAPVMRTPSDEQLQRLSELTALVETAKKAVNEASTTSPSRQTAWESEFTKLMASTAEVWQVLDPTSVTSSGGATLTKQDDHSWLASGINPAHDEYKIVAAVKPGKFSGVLLEALPDASLPNQSLGRYPNGNFVLTDVDAVITAPSLTEPFTANFTRAESDYDQNGYPVKAIIEGKATRNGKNTKGWAIDGPTRRDPRKAMFVTALPLEIPADATLTITLRHDAIGGHNIGRFRLSISSLPSENLKLDGNSFPSSLRSALMVEASKRSDEQQAEVSTYFRQHGDTVLKRAEQEVAEATKVRDAHEAAFPMVMVMKEKPKPRDAFLLIRGEYDRVGEKVERGLPAAFPPLPEGQPMDRLGLAKWLVSRDHPLTARVWVNRLWEDFFGTGLVKSSENLGSQSDWPSHPELLDWLAVEFMSPSQATGDDGSPGIAWDMKAMRKMIVMSETYRQSSQGASPNDPENRLLARGPRFRLAAETVRDQALAISGLLTTKIGGPSTRPYMPQGVWDETSRYGNLRGYKNDTDDGLYRRSMYTIWKRTAASPSMMLFDAPSREVCTVRRSRTNTPLQALVLLNEVTFVEAARKLAERMMAGGEGVEARLAYGFRLATARNPTHQELDVLRSGLEDDLKRFESSPQDAGQLLVFGNSLSDKKFDPDELAAYTLAANVILNLDEVITRE